MFHMEQTVSLFLDEYYRFVLFSDKKNYREQ